MLRKIIALVLIVLAGGGWLLLDHLNQQQLQEAEELRRAVEQARAQALTHARAMADARTKFAARILAELNACKAEAEKARNDFVNRNRKPVPRKPGEFTIPQTVADKAARMQESADAACQATYDTRMQGNF